MTDMPDLPSTFRYDRDILRYRDGDRVVSDDELKAVALLLAQQWSDQMAAMTKSLREGAGLEQWRAGMQRILSDAHPAMMAIGAGNELTIEHRVWLDGQMRIQNAYLDGFSEAMGDEQYRVSDAAVRRAELYGAASNATFEQSRRISYLTRGFMWERNILGETDMHCPQCLEVTDRGWQFSGTLPLPGQRLCMVNCKCRLEFAAFPILENDDSDLVGAAE